MRLRNIKKLVVEDFPQEDQPVISKIGFILNDFMTQTTNIINGNIGPDNLTQKVVTFDVSVNSSGSPAQGVEVNVGITNPKGTNVINAINTTNSAITPVSQPFISFTPLGNGSIKINKITGLQEGSKYSITAIIY